MIMRIVCLLVGFAFGSIPCGFLIATSQGVDIRHIGSGNVGSTNIMRNMGKRFGALTLALDILKGVIPILIMAKVFGAQDSRLLVTMWTGLGAVLGHDYSPFLGFNGGKGIATSGGVVLTTDPGLFIVLLVTIFATAIGTGYVSLGSMIGCCMYFVWYAFIILSGRVPGWFFYKQTYDPVSGKEILTLALIMTLIAVWRHRANIKRLMTGNENKISFKSKK